MGNVHRISLDEIPFNQRARDYKSIDLDYKKLGVFPKIATGWLAAPSIIWWLFWKHLENVHRSSLNEIPFNQRARDYKSTDLDYKIHGGNPKKATLSHIMAFSTINKIGIAWTTLIDHSQDLPGPWVTLPRCQRLYILGPGLQAGGKGGVMHGLQHHQ